MVRAALLSILLEAALPAIGFQQTDLGATLESVRARQISDGSYGPRRIGCSDQNISDLNTFHLDAAHRRAGEVRCGMVERIGGYWVRSEEKLTSDREAMVDYRFYRGRLYKIEVYADADAAEVILRGLSDRFGSPSGRATDFVQNAYGATFPQRFTTWVRGDQSVTMVAPAMTTRRMVVVYSDRPIEKVVEAEIAANERAHM